MSLQLFLVNNDPLATIFMTSTGQMMYSAKTSMKTSDPITPSMSNAPTRISRLSNAVSQSRGHIETEIGSIEPLGSSEKEATVNIYLEKSFQLHLGEGDLKSLDGSLGVSIEDAERSSTDLSSQMTLHKE
jgi:hypothetical protein